MRFMRLIAPQISLFQQAAPRKANMEWLKDSFSIATRGKGLVPFTQMVETRLRQWQVNEGMCFLYIPHTSASLAICESYDPTARLDLEAFLERLAPEDQPWHRHRVEGPDDSPSHMRALLTQTSLEIPIDDGQLSLGTWQGIYLCEHRSASHRREVLLRCLKVA
jgi:secondary thiamine-phosphate synthase enzyme